MEEFKGTPGDWNYSLNKDGRVISIHTGDTSAEVNAGNDEWKDPNICGIWYDDLDISMADAQLISASKDLLQACQRLLNNGFRREDQRFAEQAINKALGKEATNV